MTAQLERAKEENRLAREARKGKLEMAMEEEEAFDNLLEFIFKLNERCVANLKHLVSGKHIFIPLHLPGW